MRAWKPVQCHHSWIRPVPCIAAVAVLLTTLAPAVDAQTPAERFQQALERETAAGDLEGAIALYRSLVETHGDDAEVAADAQLHIGLCYEKLGRREAMAAYRRVIADFPTQTQIVDRARARLQALEQADAVARRQEGAGPEKTDQVVAELDAARARVHAYRGTQTTQMELMGRTVTAEGGMWVRDSGQMRLELTSPIPATNSLTVFDGRTSWTYQTAAGLVAKVDVAALAQEFPEEALVNNATLNPFQSLDRQSLRFVRSDVIADEPVRVFQGDADGRAARAGMGMAPDWLEVAVGADDGLTRSLTAYDDSGAVLMRMAFTVDELNPDLPDSLFVLAVPEGATVVDMTTGVRDMLAKLHATDASPAAAPAPPAPPDAGAVIDELQAAAAAVTTWRAETSRQMQMMGSTVTSEAKEWHGGHGRSRQEMESSMTPGLTIAVHDSAESWTWMPMLKMAQHMDNERLRQFREAAQAKTDAPRGFEGMVRDSIVVVGRQVLEGVDVYHMAGPSTEVPKGLGIGPYGRVEIWIGVADGLVRQRLVHDLEGKQIIRETRTGVQVNVDLPDSLFTFTPPEDAQVMDLTESVVKRMQQMQQDAAAADGQ